MIDTPRFTNRFLTQFGFTLIWTLLYTALNSFSTSPLIMRIILVIIGIALLIGILPGSFLKGFLQRVSARTHGTFIKMIVLLAFLMPLLMGGILVFMIYDSYNILTSPLLKDLLKEHNVQMDLIYEIIGLLLQLTFLISNIFISIRRDLKTPVESQITKELH